MPSASAAASAGPVDAGNADAEAAEDEAVAEELQVHHRHEHTGFAGFVISSVDTVGAGPEQQAAIDTFRKEFHTKMKPVHEANIAMLGTLADGIAAGTIDKAKVDAAIAKTAAAATAAHPALNELLMQLHATLRPEQRAALVDKVDAHFATWREANEHPIDPTKPDHHVKHITKELGLSKDQVEKFKANLAAEKEPKKPFEAAAFEAYVKAFDTEFATDKFDAKKLPPAGPGSSAIITRGAERMAAFYEALVPVLTPEQRPTLADKVRAHADKAEKAEKKEKK